MSFYGDDSTYEIQQLTLQQIMTMHGVNTMTNEPDIIIVHTGESRTLRYNPLVHGELHQEMPDGDITISVLPLEVLEERRRVLGEVK